MPSDNFQGFATGLWAYLYMLGSCEPLTIGFGNNDLPNVFHFFFFFLAVLPLTKSNNILRRTLKLNNLVYRYM